MEWYVEVTRAAWVTRPVIVEAETEGEAKIKAECGEWRLPIGHGSIGANEIDFSIQAKITVGDIEPYE